MSNEQQLADFVCTLQARDVPPPAQRIVRQVLLAAGAKLNDAFLLEHLDRVGYKGWIGGEYKPAAGTEAGLGWIHALTR